VGATDLERKLLEDTRRSEAVPDIAVSALIAALSDLERANEQSRDNRHMLEECLKFFSLPPIRYQLNILDCLAWRVALGMESSGGVPHQPFALRYRVFESESGWGDAIGKTSSADGGAVLGATIIGDDLVATSLPVAHFGSLLREDPLVLALPVGTVLDPEFEDEELGDIDLACITDENSLAATTVEPSIRSQMELVTTPHSTAETQVALSPPAHRPRRRKPTGPR
jgi:hypothetical protein